MAVTLLLSLPLASLAQSKETMPNATLDSLNGATPLGGPMFMAPFRYIPPGGATQGQEPDLVTIKRKPEQQRIIDLNSAGDYRAAGTEGLALMSQEKQDDDLQLIVANSLAWTGRAKEAIPTYQRLIKGKYANEANIGIANLQRWSGRDDLAAPIYREVLANATTNPDALEGLELSTRELSPRTTFGLGAAKDSSDIQRRSNMVNHRWRDKSGTNIMEIEVNGVKDWSPNIETRQQDVTLRYESLALALKPSMELSMPTGGNSTLFGSVRLKVADDAASISVGRVNWGRMASNPNALALGLSATHIGLTADYTIPVGELRGRINYFGISDSNSIVSSNIHFTPNWRPIGNSYKPFLGVETRAANFASPNYWSPEAGAGTLYAGLLGEWGAADWNIYASGQTGVRLYGDSGRSWSVTGGGKRWLSNDLALSMNLWSMSSWRDNAAYRAQSANVSLEKLWR